jgi:NTE family protein
MLTSRKSFQSLLLALFIASVLSPQAFADQAIDANPKPPETRAGEETVFPKPCVESSTDTAKTEPEHDKDSKVVSPESIPVSKVPDTVGIIETTRGWMIDIEKWKAEPKKARPKIGLALGGGGARGAAHVPIIRALEKEGIKFDYIAGTSIGAVVGGLYAAGVSLDDMEDEFENGKIMKNFMTVSLAVRIAVAPVLYLPRMLGSKEYDGLYKGNKFRKYLVSGLSCHDMNIENLKTPFAAISLNLLDGKPYMIRKGNLGFAMQASSAVPGLRKPVEIGDYLFVDGGTLINLPVKQVREMGADFVIAVNIDQPFPIAPKEQFRKPGSVTTRMLNWDLWDMDRPQVGLADFTFHPNTENVSLISTKKADALKCAKAGEEAAQAGLPALREMLKNYGIATTTSQKSE